MTLLRPRKVQPTSRPVDEAVRTLVVWVPDWPLVAAGVPVGEPAAVFVANRVVACTAAARAADVTRGMRRREAQARCPSLLVLDADPDRDARRFEPVVQALEALTPRIEVTRPGRCAFPTRGPSRYFGGDEALAARAVDLVAGAFGADGPHPSRNWQSLRDTASRNWQSLRDTASRNWQSLRDIDADGGERGEPLVAVGIADGPFAAAHAARTARVRAARGDGPPTFVVAPGASAEYLAPLPLRALDRPGLVDVLDRLGLATLGDLAALPPADVLGRFGTEGIEAHRLSRGLDHRPPATMPPPEDLVVEATLDPPADQIAPVAFVARGLADELHRRLEAKGSVCTRVVVIAETEHGERSERAWRHANAGAPGALTAGAIADRVRWQLEGWLHANSRQRPTAGIVQLRLQPDEVGPATGRQLGFWGGDAAAAARAARAVARVQGLLDAKAVRVPEYAGGREPAEQLRLVPAGTVDLTTERPSTEPDWVTEPWPGRLPAPSPATVHRQPQPVDVVDATGRMVAVDGRCTLTAPPAQLRIGRGRSRITSWAGPWPVDERWWDADRASRRARFQVVTDDGTARLVVLEGGRWSLAATYD